MKIPALKRGSIEVALGTLRSSLASIVSGPHRSTRYDLIWEGLRYPPKVVIAKALEIENRREFTTKEFSGGEAAANAALRDLKFEVVAKSSHTGRLPLILHHRYSRHEVYGCFGIGYTQQQRYLNLGLSPQLSDKGYFDFHNAG